MPVKQSTYGYLSSSIAILLETGILPTAMLVAIAKFMNDCSMKHAGTLAMYKDYFLSGVFYVFFHYPIERIHLILQDVGGIHSLCSVKELVSMQIDNNGTIVTLGLMIFFFVTLTLSL